MTISEFVNQLHTLGIVIGYENDRIKCNAPKGVLTPELAEEIKIRKPELIAFLREALTATESTPEDSVVPAARMQPLPLTVSQRSIWYVEQLMPGTQAYNLPCLFRFEGPLDHDLFKRCISEIVARHEILRTTFTMDNGEPVQIVHPPYLPEIELIDVADRYNGNDDIFWQQLQKAVMTPFDVTNGPLLMVKLVRLHPEVHLFFWMTHHLIWDGWSFDIMINEVAALYAAYSKGMSSPLEPLPVQFADYAVWQKKWLNGDDARRQLDYWFNKLEGDRTELNLPYDFGRPNNPSRRGGSINFHLSNKLFSALKVIGTREDASIFMVLLAGYYVMLYRYAGQNDISIGCPMWGRTKPEIERLIGYLTNNVVLRINLDGVASFREILRRVRQTSLEANSNHTIPFEQIVDRWPGDKSPFFQALFSYQDARARPLSMGDIRITQIPEPFTGISSFDLFLWFKEVDAECKGRINFSRDIFAEETALRFAGNLRVLYEAIAANPDKAIAELDLLSPEEKEQMLVGWNATEKEFLKNTGMHELFEQQVERTPERPALEFMGERITYAELDRSVNRLAHHLIEHGAGPGQIIGIFLERSFEMVQAALAILKTGAAYLPLDTAFPAERLFFMVSDAKIRIIVTSETGANRLPESEITTVVPDRDAPVTGDYPESKPVNASFNPEDPAYVIYTSGTTGTPKGVLVPHRAVVNFLTGMSDTPGISQDDVVLAITTLSFDIAVLELFLPLCTGAQCIIAPRETVSSGKALADMVQNSGATLLQATPATWQLLLESGWKGSSGGLKILCGGERLSRDLAARLLPVVAELWNMYGPTETTVWSTCHRITESGKKILIGRPIANTTVYILDNNLQPVPAGLVGELYIGGAGVTLGYLNRQELTQEKYLPDPFSRKPGAIMYRTGDLARFQPDGTVECLGRIDNQLKIRGFRIEPEEIEAVLQSSGSIDDCVVTAFEAAPGDVRLVAYLKANNNATPSPEEMRGFLSTKIPDYMVPQHFVMVEALPISPNGKIDRKQLPPPMVTVSGETTVTTPPRSETEKLLAEIWIHVLKIKSISINDNFFALGGHSLLAVQMFSQILEKTGINLPLAVLMRTPTIAGLAAALDSHKTDEKEKSGFSVSDTTSELPSPWSFLVPIRPEGTRTPFYCVHGVGGNVMNYYPMTQYLPADQPFYGLQSRGLDGISKPFSSVESMAQAYVEEIRQVQPHGPYILGGGSMGGLVAYEMAQNLVNSGERVDNLIMFDTVCVKYYKPLPVHGTTVGLAGRKKKNLLQKLPHSIWCRIEDAFKYGKCYSYRMRGIPIPHELRYWQVEQKHFKIAEKYDPKPYAGMITYFRASQNYGCSDPYRGWKNVVKDGMHFHDFACPHETMIEHEGVLKSLNEILIRNG